MKLLIRSAAFFKLILKIDVDLKNLQMIVEVPDVSVDNDPPVSALEKIRNRSTEILENEIG